MNLAYTTLARFNRPGGITIDSTANLYVTESGNSSVRKISPSGVVTTFASGIQFSDEIGITVGAYGSIAVDAPGNVYVSRFAFTDVFTHAPDTRDYYTSDEGYVTRIAPDGTRSDLWETQTQKFADGRYFDGFVTALTFNAQGQLIATDGNRIVRYSPGDSALKPVAGDGLSGALDGAAAGARFESPLGLAYDRNGALYIADAGNNTVRKLDSAGIVSTPAGLAVTSAADHIDGSGPVARFQSPVATALDGNGNIYVADSHFIRKITPAGVVSTVADLGTGSGSVDGLGAGLDYPRGLAVDAAGIIYVANTYDHTIRKILPGAEATTLAGASGNAGEQDGQGAAARFVNPRGIAVDSTGNVYVTSAERIRKISPTGLTTTLAGSTRGYADGPASAAQFTSPCGIAVDASNNIFVTEASNDPAIARIRKISPSGIVTTIAGADHGSTDGNETVARFHDPFSLAVDAAGNLYVADRADQTIRKISAQGIVTTIGGVYDVPGSSDGTGEEARFYYPQGIAVDSPGTIYVASSTTVRKGLAAAMPLITAQPSGLTVAPGGAAQFTVTAGGTPTPTLQWNLNGSPVAGATTSTLNISNVRAGDAGDYTVVVTNSLGSVTSSKATLIISAATQPPAGNSATGGGSFSIGSAMMLLALVMVRIQVRSASDAFSPLPKSRVQ